MTALGFFNIIKGMTKKITKKPESIKGKVRKMVKNIPKKVEKKKADKPSVKKSPKKTVEVLKKIEVKVVDKELIGVLKPLLSLPGSLRRKGEAIVRYAQSTFCDLDTLKVDVQKIVTIAESIGSGPFEDIKKYLKKM